MNADAANTLAANDYDELLRQIDADDGCPNCVDDCNGDA
jgi:hypothetical protein